MPKPDHIDTLRHRIGLAANCEPVELLAIVLDCLSDHDSRLAALEAKTAAVPATPQPTGETWEPTWDQQDTYVETYCAIDKPGDPHVSIKAARTALGVPALEARLAQAEADRAELLAALATIRTGIAFDILGARDMEKSELQDVARDAISQLIDKVEAGK